MPHLFLLILITTSLFNINYTINIANETEHKKLIATLTIKTGKNIKLCTSILITRQILLTSGRCIGLIIKNSHVCSCPVMELDTTSNSLKCKHPYRVLKGILTFNKLLGLLLVETPILKSVANLAPIIFNRPQTNCHIYRFARNGSNSSSKYLLVASKVKVNKSYHSTYFISAVLDEPVYKKNCYDEGGGPLICQEKVIGILEGVQSEEDCATYGKKIMVLDLRQHKNFLESVKEIIYSAGVRLCNTSSIFAVFISTLRTVLK